jgi:hypothetical protein
LALVDHVLTKTVVDGKIDAREIRLIDFA